MATRSAHRKSSQRALDVARRARQLEADLRSVVSLPEFRDMALEVMETGAFDYVDGGSWDELSLAENEDAWMRFRLRPRVLVDVSRIDPATTLLGVPVAFPVAIAPMAAHGLANPAAELATVRASTAAGVPFTLSTMSSASIEEVAQAAPEGIRWFQLYMQADPGRSRSLVERAAAADYRAIIVTVDLPVLGYRERDRLNAFELTTPLGNFAGETGPTHGDHGVTETGYERLASRPAVSLTWRDLATIRSWSALPLVLKGITTAEDARLAADHGAAAVVVSNHGARQLDRVAAPIDVLEEIVVALGGRAEIWADGGVRRGLDIAIAVALGARGVLLGRPILWALAAGGQAGVERALVILREEFEIALSLLGTPTPADITRAHVTG